MRNPLEPEIIAGETLLPVLKQCCEALRRHWLSSLCCWLCTASKRAGLFADPAPVMQAVKACMQCLQSFFELAR